MKSCMDPVRELEELLSKNPTVGVTKIAETYKAAVKDHYHGDTAYLSSLGGPCEGSVCKVYDVVGVVYPDLTREQKDEALRQLLDVWGHLKHNEVQFTHTAFIDEPLLSADIYIAGRDYWPGIDGRDSPLLKKLPNSNVGEVIKQILDEDGDILPKACSRFVVAYALLRNDFWKDKENNAKFAEALNPAFLDSTIKGITWMRFGYKTFARDPEGSMARIKELMPKSQHDKIEQYEEEGGWADYRNFRG